MISTAHTTVEREEFTRRAQTLYLENIRPQLADTDRGKTVAIEVESGQWEMDADELAAVQKLKDRLGEHIRVFAQTVGQRGTYWGYRPKNGLWEEGW